MCPVGIRPAECIVISRTLFFGAQGIFYSWLGSPSVLAGSPGRLWSPVQIDPLRDLSHKDETAVPRCGCALYPGWVLFRTGTSMGCCCLWALADGGVNQRHWRSNHFCLLRTLEYAAYFNTCSGMIFFSAFSGNCIFDVDAVVFISLLCFSTGPCKFCLSLLPSTSYCFVFIFKAQPFLVPSNHRSPSVAGFLNQSEKTLCNVNCVWRERDSLFSK